MSRKAAINNCRYTEGVGCDEASDFKCARCGYKPSVHAMRVKKIKDELLRNIENEKQKKS